jgi:hypothetical protein
MSDDQGVQERIEALVKEEHALQSREAGDATDVEALAADRRRLDAINVELDQCWDLLRQRRARRSAGEDPDRAVARGSETVEHFLQ